VALDVYDWLEARIEACVAAGIARERIIVDPGIGFGKSFRHNLDLLRQFTLFHGLGVPLLMGLSRKGFIGALTGENMQANACMDRLAAPYGQHFTERIFFVCMM
jgi:dihydropteroate synthase